MSRGGDWWPAFFDDQYADLALAALPADEGQRVAAFLRDHAGVRPGDTVFDQCCGVGRLSLALAKAGFRTVGVDQSAAYVQRARAAAAAAGLRCEFFVGDAFRFVPPQPCAAAVNWFTSFGYTADDATNAAMAQRAFDALRPGGRFVLECAHVPYVLRRFQPVMVERHPAPGGETLVIRETTVDLAGGMFEQTWTFVAPDGRRSVRTGATKLYLPHTLRELLERCGFRAVMFHGSTDGAPLTLDSPRCLCIAVKPGGPADG